MLAKLSTKQLRLIQNKPLVLVSAPFIGFVTMIIFRKQCRSILKHFLSTVNGGAPDSKQTIGKLARFKKVLFENIKDVRSSDEALEKQGKMRILEINPGAGSNMEYYPKGTQVIVLEKDGTFQKIHKEKPADFRHITIERFVSNYSEKMVDIEDESVDVVVASLTLCSSQDPRLTIREIKRILTPGGRFYFVEHVNYHENTWSSSVQNLINPLWKACNEGCFLNRNSSDVINYVGFRTIHMKKYYPKELPFLIRPLIVGYAIK